MRAAQHGARWLTDLAWTPAASQRRIDLREAKASPAGLIQARYVGYPPGISRIEGCSALTARQIQTGGLLQVISEELVIAVETIENTPSGSPDSGAPNTIARHRFASIILAAAAEADQNTRASSSTVCMKGSIDLDLFC